MQRVNDDVMNVINVHNGTPIRMSLHRGTGGFRFIELRIGASTRVVFHNRSSEVLLEAIRTFVERRKDS